MSVFHFSCVAEAHFKPVGKLKRFRTNTEMFNAYAVTEKLSDVSKLLPSFARQFKTFSPKKFFVGIWVRLSADQGRRHLPVPIFGVTKNRRSF